MRIVLLLAVIVFLLLMSAGLVQAGQYFQDFSAFSVGDTFNDGSQLVSTSLGTLAAVTDATYKELKLKASPESGVISAFVLPDLNPATPPYEDALIELSPYSIENSEEPAFLT